MFLALLYFALPLVDVLLSAEVSGLPGGDRLDCVKASDQCLKEQSCSTKYRTLRQCVAGKESNFSRATGLEAKDECKSAMEALKQKSLYNCRCKRGMKKEKNCLRIYWSMYQSLQGNDLLEDSPYEPVNSRLSDIFRLAPIVSVEPVLSKGNNCLDAAKACNLNDTCKRFRSAYITPCTSSTSNEICNKRKCHKALRLFFDKVPPKHSYGMLFCSCRDVACTERRRQTIVPVCSYEDREKPNCLNLQESCKKNYICRYLNTSSNVKRGGSEHVQSSPNIAGVSAEDSSPAYTNGASSGNHSLGHHSLRACGQQEIRIQCRSWSEDHHRQGKAKREDFSLSGLSPRVPAIEDAYGQRGKMKSRLADFFTNCQPESRSVSSCLKENYADCLLAYSGLIGTVMTPNYIDSNSLSVAPWCDCSNSGNDIDECLKFLNFFQDNTCLKNAIQAFGNGTDVNVWQPILPVQTTTATTTTASRLKNIGSETTNNEIPTHNDSPACANLQAQKKRKSNESVDTELCLNENAIGKDNTAGVSTSHISSENSLALPRSFYRSTLLTLMTLALPLCLFLSSSVVL